MRRSIDIVQGYYYFIIALKTRLFTIPIYYDKDIFNNIYQYMKTLNTDSLINIKNDL